MTGARRAKVLAVDDRRENLVALQAILEGLAIEVVAVGGGEDALKQLLVDDFAVILLDRSELTAAAGGDASRVRLGDVLRPALEQAAGVIGGGMLGDAGDGAPEESGARGQAIAFRRRLGCDNHGCRPIIDA